MNHEINKSYQTTFRAILTKREIPFKRKTKKNTPAKSNE